MDNNKYKNKINKEREKCEKIIKKLYGNVYYFMHGTTETSIENILKSGKIKIGTHTDDRNFTHESYLSLPYAYCNIEFDDVPIKYMRPLFPFILLIHPKILNAKCMMGHCCMADLPTDTSKTESCHKATSLLSELQPRWRLMA